MSRLSNMNFYEEVSKYSEKFYMHSSNPFIIECCLEKIHYSLTEVNNNAKYTKEDFVSLLMYANQIRDAVDIIRSLCNLTKEYNLIPTDMYMDEINESVFPHVHDNKNWIYCADILNIQEFELVYREREVENLSKNGGVARFNDFYIVIYDIFCTDEDFKIFKGVSTQDILECIYDYVSNILVVGMSLK